MSDPFSSRLAPAVPLRDTALCKMAATSKYNNVRGFSQIKALKPEI